MTNAVPICTETPADVVLRAWLKRVPLLALQEMGDRTEGMGKAGIVPAIMADPASRDAAVYSWRVERAHGLT